MKKIFAWTLIQIANGANILSSIIIAHALSANEFGKFATLAATIATMTALLNPLMNELAHSVARTGTIHLGSLKQRSVVSVLLCSAIAFLGCRTIASTPLNQFLIFLVIPLMLVLSSWALGIATGLHAVRLLGVVQLTGALSRLALLTVGIMISESFLPAAWAYLLGFIVMTALGTQQVSSMPISSEKERDISWSIAIGFFLLALPFSLDQVLVQTFFPSLSGEYAAVMTYAKSVMVMASPALTIAFSSSLQKNARATCKRESIRVLGLCALLVIPLAGSFWLARSLLFPLLLGSHYAHLASHLGLALTAISLHVMAYSVIQRSLSGASGWFVAALSLPVLAQVAWLLSLSAPTIRDLVTVSVVAFGAQVALFLTSYCIPTACMPTPQAVDEA